MLLAVRISSYGCTWEVWRALNKLACEYSRFYLLLAAKARFVRRQERLRLSDRNSILMT